MEIENYRLKQVYFTSEFTISLLNWLFCQHDHLVSVHNILGGLCMLRFFYSSSLFSTWKLISSATILFSI